MTMEQERVAVDGAIVLPMKKVVSQSSPDCLINDEDLNLEARAVNEKGFGADYASTSISRARNTDIVQGQGKLDDDEEPLVEKIVESQRKIPGVENNNYVASALHKRDGLLEGDYDVEPLYREGLAVEKMSNGDAHQDAALDKLVVALDPAMTLRRPLSHKKTMHLVQDQREVDSAPISEETKQSIACYFFGTLTLSPTVDLSRVYSLFVKCSKKSKQMGRSDWNQFEEDCFKNMRALCQLIGKRQHASANMYLISGLENMLEALYDAMESS